ncbi:MAG: DUF1549 and DUF1553 domain-containing protein [Acidobacteria bacterium]|nr:DUF1549 and DUF1553 domain-containing protein [Acidobacteriota bacterium]
MKRLSIALLLGISTLWTQTSNSRREFWSFRSPVKVPGKSIDEFLQAKLKAKGLSPNPRADQRTLIRRLHFDLTGLPPQPEDYKRSYEDTVEHLLASPHYAERWARHWLDVVRFGETDGGEHNYERMHAWPYRDYVIDAFRTDKPYTQFIREQIAGDLIEPENPKMIAATGFLVAGPWDQVSAELNKDKLLAAAARVDELDDMATTTFHTFQALTVNCARCHDHKFDPIPSKDFYRLTAVYGGVTFGTRRVAKDETIKAYDAQTKPIRDRLNATNQKLADIEDPVRTAMLLERYRAFDQQRISAPRRMPLNAIWNRNAFPSEKATKLRLVITNHQSDRPRLEHLELQPAGITLENWTGSAKASEDAPVFIEIANPEAKAIDKIVWWTDQKTGRNTGMPRVFRLEASSDGQTWQTLCSSLDHVRDLELDLPRVSEAELVAKLGIERANQRAALQQERKRIETELTAIPEPMRLYAAKPHSMDKAFLLDRGSVAKPIEEVSPGALSAVRQIDPNLGLSNTASDSERRLALANWIANDKNPLTARVLVNRIWYNHFGNGIVNTPSDFGLNGDRPSHPELLDWLAVSFMENGWSIKWLHRQILLSEAYRQSSAMNEQAFAADGDNRLLWRMPLKRMDAEMLRDSILHASGQLRLDPIGGPSFFLQKKKERGAFIYETLDNDGPEVWRRAIYRFVVRGGERIMMDSFDCPDPSVATPQRSVSNTPVQALTLLNNDFVLRQAGLFAERLKKEAGGKAADQIRRAYQLLYGREPNAVELKLGSEFLTSQPLPIYTRALFNANEFVYVP